VLEDLRESVELAAELQQRLYGRPLGEVSRVWRGRVDVPMGVYHLPTIQINSHAL
jgi:hypothetical protein